MTKTPRKPETTGKKVATLAGKALQDPAATPREKSIAASALTQVAGKPRELVVEGNSGARYRLELNANSHVAGVRVESPSGEMIYQLSETEFAAPPASAALAFEPTDKQIAWAMNLVGPTALLGGQSLEDLLTVEQFAMLVRRIVRGVQKPNADELYRDTNFIRKIASTKGRV